MRPSPASAFHHPLDYVLASPALVRVMRVLTQHGDGLGVSDIAQRARLSLPSTRAALRRLLGAHVITGVGVGRTMICTLNSMHPLTRPLLSLFEAERAHADHLLRVIRNAAARVRPAPAAVWLFGSVARGEDTPESDIDVALVSYERDPAGQAAALRASIARAVVDDDARISIIAFSVADLRRLSQDRAQIWRDIERDAAVLFGRDPRAVIAPTSAKRKLA